MPTTATTPTTTNLPSPRGLPQHRGRVVRKQIQIKAPAPRVWEAWAVPERLSQWFTDDARGRVETGETYIWVWADFGLEVPYQVLEVEPGRRLLLSVPLPTGTESLLEIEVEGKDGWTVSRVTQSGFVGEDPGIEGDADAEVRDVASGWEIALELLKLYAERYFGQPKRSCFLARPATFSDGALRPYFHRSEFLSRWLSEEGAIGQRGQFYGLTLKGGRRASGRVLAETGREVALSWTQIDGALELKAFQAGPEEQVLGLRLTRWGGETGDDEIEDLGFILHEALDQLVDGFFRPSIDFP